jgi:hypothetical protein
MLLRNKEPSVTKNQRFSVPPSSYNIRTRPTDEIKDFKWVPRNLVTRYARNMSSCSLLTSQYSLLCQCLLFAVSATGSAHKRTLRRKARTKQYRYPSILLLVSINLFGSAAFLNSSLLISCLKNNPMAFAIGFMFVLIIYQPF